MVVHFEMRKNRSFGKLINQILYPRFIFTNELFRKKLPEPQISPIIRNYSVNTYSHNILIAYVVLNFVYLCNVTYFPYTIINQGKHTIYRRRVYRIFTL